MNELCELDGVVELWELDKGDTDWLEVDDTDEL